MANTEIYAFGADGNALLIKNISNIFRGAASIWRLLEEKYLPQYIPEYAKSMGIKTKEDCKNKLNYIPSRCTAMTDEKAMTEIWNLVDNPDVSEDDKICLYTTFDGCLIKQNDIPKVSKAFRSFEGDTSLKEQADVLDEIYNSNLYMAIGWNQSGVNNNWSTFGGIKDGIKIPYNCLTGTYHYWLFDDLKNF